MMKEPYLTASANKPIMHQENIGTGSPSLLILLSLFFLVMLHTPRAALASPKVVTDILLLSSYHAGFAWDDGIKKAVSDVLNPEENNINLRIEYMDSKRISDPSYVRVLYQLYQHKYNKNKPGIIIASDNFAFDFLRSYRDELFPGVPVVFCGVNFFKDSMLEGHRLFTGVAEEFDAAGTLKIILKLHPGTKELYVLNDTDITGSAWANSIREQLTSCAPPGLTISYAGPLTADEALKKIGTLSPATVVLLGVFLRDRDGEFISAPTFARKLTAACPVPIYGLLDLYAGYGIVGGEIIDGYHQGEMAAKIVERILSGEPADSIPVYNKGVTRAIFDHSQLQRFGISEWSLPQGTILLNRPDTFYGRYRTYVWTVTTSFLALTIIVAVLSLLLRRSRLLEKRVLEGEKSLKQAYAEMETQVQNRTQELHSTNTALAAEINERKLTLTALHKAKMLLEKTFASLNEAIFIVETGTRKVLDCNTTCEKMFGYTRQEMIGSHTSFLHISEEMSERFSYEMQQAYAEKGLFETTFIMKRKDGTVFDSEHSVTPIHDELGVIASHVCVVRNVSERKQADEALKRSLKEKDVMLKEIHHRVKNNMQVVSSLLSLQARGIADIATRDIFEESRNRVHSMALIHEELYQSKDLSCIDFKEYLQRLLANIAETYHRQDVTSVVKMDSLILDVNQGVPCGLIVNELLSNSFKHAFPAEMKGTITVGINRNNEGDNVLTVADNGIGFPTEVDFRNTSSLGMQLVNGLTTQLHGKIEVSRTAGTRISITFPRISHDNGVQNGQDNQ